MSLYRNRGSGLLHGIDRRNRSRNHCYGTRPSLRALQGSARQPAKIFYAPKPIQPMQYLDPMKPLVRLADLKAKHAGPANWSELVVYDKNNRAEVISAAPGSQSCHATCTPTLPNTGWCRKAGLRFEIEDPPGQFQIL